MELFIRHLIYDVLAKKTIDKVLKLIRKLDWSDPGVQRVLFKTFTKPWKIKYGSISLLAMLTYDLQRYHPAFAVSVVDQVLEDIRLGLENNIYNTNQRRVAAIKYLGELYIYRLLSSGIIFDTFWSLVTFGYRELLFSIYFSGSAHPIDSGWPTIAPNGLLDGHARRFLQDSPSLCASRHVRDVLRSGYSAQEARQFPGVFPGIVLSTPRQLLTHSSCYLTVLHSLQRPTPDGCGIYAFRFN